MKQSDAISKTAALSEYPPPPILPPPRPKSFKKPKHKKVTGKKDEKPVTN